MDGVGRGVERRGLGWKEEERRRKRRGREGRRIRRSAGEDMPGGSGESGCLGGGAGSGAKGS